VVGEGAQGRVDPGANLGGDDEPVVTERVARNDLSRARRLDDRRSHVVQNGLQ
jgi:hypothetical protein